MSAEAAIINVPATGPNGESLNITGEFRILSITPSTTPPPSNGGLGITATQAAIGGLIALVALKGSKK